MLTRYQTIIMDPLSIVIIVILIVGFVIQSLYFENRIHNSIPDIPETDIQGEIQPHITQLNDRILGAMDEIRQLIDETRKFFSNALGSQVSYIDSKISSIKIPEIEIPDFTNVFESQQFKDSIAEVMIALFEEMEGQEPESTVEPERQAEIGKAVTQAATEVLTGGNPYISVIVKKVFGDDWQQRDPEEIAVAMDIAQKSGIMNLFGSFGNGNNQSKSTNVVQKSFSDW